MLESEKTAYVNEWCIYQEQNTNLENYRGQTYSLTMGKFKQLLQDNMKQDTYWNDTSTSYNPLVLIHLIEKMIFAQAEYQYPFATVYDQDLNFYIFRQSSMNILQWYDRFNTKVYVSKSIGVTRQHKALL